MLANANRTNGIPKGAISGNAATSTATKIVGAGAATA
jgi:hypothetical protein